jgi:hypothetical protein
MYREMLEAGGPTFDTVFRHLVDKPEETCLVHCTGMKFYSSGLPLSGVQSNFVPSWKG